MFVEFIGLFRSQGELCFVFGRFVRLLTAVPFSGRTVLRVWIDLCDYWTVPFSGENCASCLDRFVRLLDCSVLRGELCVVFGLICAIIGLFRSQGRTLLRVWIDLCDYWTAPFSGENVASCLDRFVRLLDCSVLSGELCFVFGSICAIIGLFRSQGRTLLRVWINLCDYWTVPFSGRTLLRVWIDLCEF